MLSAAEIRKSILLCYVAKWGTTKSPGRSPHSHARSAKGLAWRGALQRRLLAPSLLGDLYLHFVIWTLPDRDGGRDRASRETWASQVLVQSKGTCVGRARMPSMHLSLDPVWAWDRMVVLNMLPSTPPFQVQFISIQQLLLSTCKVPSWLWYGLWPCAEVEEQGLAGPTSGPLPGFGSPKAKNDFSPFYLAF